MAPENNFYVGKMRDGRLRVEYSYGRHALHMYLKNRNTILLHVLHPHINLIPTWRELEWGVFVVEVRCLGSLPQICALNKARARPRAHAKNRARGLGVHAATDVREEEAALAEYPLDIHGGC